MDVLSSHMCFQVDGNPVTDADLWSKMVAILQQCAKCLQTPACVDVANGNKILVASGENESHWVMNIYSHGLVTLDIQYDCKPSSDTKRTLRYDSYAKCKAIESKIEEILEAKCKYTRSLPTAIERGRVCPYFVHGDDTMFESTALMLVEEVKSPWQNIKIYRSHEYGNILCLDDEIMIAESDDIYTSTLLGLDRNDFQNKSILLLGGGDGGLLHELLKHSPKFVLMVEIDVEVIHVSERHLRSLCGDSLDKLSGSNYEIRIDNCMNVLAECARSDRRFDYVINDLSEYLIDTEKAHDIDQVTSRKILEISMGILAPGGKYLSRGETKSATTELESLTSDINSLGLQFEKLTVDVPSYREKYCIFHVWKPDINGVL